MAEQRLTTLSDYVGVLRRRLWVVVLAVVIAVGAAYFVSSRQTPAYEATAQVNVGANSIQTILNPASKISSSVVTQQLASAASFAHTTTIAKQALALAHVTDLTPKQLLDESSVTRSEERRVGKECA